MLRPVLASALVVLLHSTFACRAIAQAVPPDAAAEKQSALKWLDRFAQVQVLFHDEDMQKLRAKLTAMSPEEVSQWWKERAAIRELLDSARWQDTQNWLREFLRVQARYSDEEIRDFQSEAFTKAKESPESLSEVLEGLIQYRQRFRAATQASAEMRELQLEANQAFRQEQVRQREARWHLPPPQANTAQPVAPRPRTSPPPLVDSLDVARWTILNQLFPRWSISR